MDVGHRSPTTTAGATTTQVRGGGDCKNNKHATCNIINAKKLCCGTVSGCSLQPGCLLQPLHPDSHYHKYNRYAVFPDITHQCWLPNRGRIWRRHCKNNSKHATCNIIDAKKLCCGTASGCSLQPGCLLQPLLPDSHYQKYNRYAVFSDITHQCWLPNRGRIWSLQPGCLLQPLHPDSHYHKYNRYAVFSDITHQCWLPNRGRIWRRHCKNSKHATCNIIDAKKLCCGTASGCSLQPGCLLQPLLPDSHYQKYNRYAVFSDITHQCWLPNRGRIWSLQPGCLLQPLHPDSHYHKYNRYAVFPDITHQCSLPNRGRIWRRHCKNSKHATCNIIDAKKLCCGTASGCSLQPGCLLQPLLPDSHYQKYNRYAVFSDITHQCWLPNRGRIWRSTVRGSMQGPSFGAGWSGAGASCRRRGHCPDWLLLIASKGSTRHAAASTCAINAKGVKGIRMSAQLSSPPAYHCR
ncbi:uncharacterized protein LOC144159764 [Haemaphysalis longicornis]